MAQLIDKMVQATRRMATTVRPQLLDDFALVAALQWQVQEFQERTDTICTLMICPESLKLDQALATTVFRLIQEALTNVARHAHATHVTIDLHGQGDTLRLNILDNGKGISLPVDPKSLGLLGMRQRVQQWGGTMQIRKGGDAGTLLRFRIPLAHPTNRQ